MWNREELFWGVVNPCSPEILSGSCRTDLLCVCLAFLRDYQHACSSYARDREATDRGDAGGQPAGNSSTPRGLQLKANSSHVYS